VRSQNSHTIFRDFWPPHSPLTQNRTIPIFLQRNVTNRWPPPLLPKCVRNLWTSPKGKFEKNHSKMGVVGGKKPIWELMNSRADFVDFPFWYVCRFSCQANELWIGQAHIFKNQIEKGKTNCSMTFYVISFISIKKTT
jgi:hypothetical protein